MNAAVDTVFLFDVDNTLLDNDRIRDDLQGTAASLRMAIVFARVIGKSWTSCGTNSGYMDYLGALERLRLEEPYDFAIFRTANWLLDYPFADRLYPHALDAVRHVRQWGTVAILSDGDAVFQPRKILRSGLWDAFDGNVLIYIHKEKEFSDVKRRHPATHYALIDDKARILAAAKLAWGDRVTTIFPKQGHYAIEEPPQDPASVDRTIDKVGDLLNHDWSWLKS